MPVVLLNFKHSKLDPFAKALSQDFNPENYDLSCLEMLLSGQKL